MADGKLQYIIEMIADDSKLRKQVAKWDWKSIMGSNGQGFSDVLLGDISGTKERVRRELGGLNIDWTKILGTKELGQLEQAVTRALSGSRKELEVFASKGDTTGIQNTIKYVSALGDELSSLGSSFDAQSLARGMGALMKVLMPISQKFSVLANEPKKVEAAFDRLFSNITHGSDRMVQVGQSFDTVGNAISEMASETNDAVAKMEKSLSAIDGLLDKKYKIKFESDLEIQLKNIQQQAQKTDDEIEELLDQLDRLSSSDDDYVNVRDQLVGKYQKRAELDQSQILINKKYISTHGKSKGLLGADELDYLQSDINESKKEIQLYLDDARRELSKHPKSMGVSSDGVNVPINIPSRADIVKKINERIAEINNSKSINGIKVGLAKSLTDSANIIPDAQKRAYGENPADNDVNTTKLVEQTEKRFDKIAKAIDDKQNLILKQTSEWRSKMLNQFKFKSGDFEFKFNDALIDELQTLFDEYALKINIDPDFLSNQIKTVLENSGGSIGGGTANIDANSMVAAVAAGLRAALTGEKIQITQTDVASNVDDNTPTQVATETEHIATEIKSSAKHLDLAEDYVKNVVERLKAIAKYASKDSDGAKATMLKFGSLGVDLGKVQTASDVGNDTEIVSIIENAFLQRDEFGNLRGSTLIDELSKFKGSSSKTIPSFIAGIEEVFFMLQEDTQTVEEWTRKRHGKETLDSARAYAKAASGLRDVRSPIRMGSIPSMEAIDTAISLMSAIGKNTDDLQALRSAREALGDKTDDVAVEEFKTAASDFYTSSTKIFWNLKKQAEDTFRGTVYFQGKNGKTYSRYYDKYSQIAKIKDDSTIVDVAVHSTLSNVALGEVRSKKSNRVSSSEERRLMRDSSRADFIVPREYEEDILSKQITYRGFRAQGLEKQVTFRPEKILESVNKYKEQVKTLQQEISELDKALQDTQLDGDQRSRIISQKNEKQLDMDNYQRLIKANEDRVRRIEIEQKYNALQEKSLILQGSIKKMEEDGATEGAIKRKQKELGKVNAELSEIYEKIMSLGGFISQEGRREYSASERKTYALEELKKIEDDLIIAKAQKRVSESRISKKDREIADLDRWGLGAGIGASELAKTKGNLTYEFMTGDYVKSQEAALREKAKAVIADAENRARQIFDKKVTTAMEYLGWDPLDQTQVKKFLGTEHGKQLSADFASDIDTNIANIWKQHDEYRSDLLTKLKADFQESFKTDNGVLTATTKAQDETGKWVDEIIEVRVREALRTRLETEKKILETKREPIQANIDRLETDRRTAIEYGGISDKELLSGDIVEDQIRKEAELAKWLEKRATIQAALNDLENAGVDKSDETYKEGKRKLKEAEQQVAWYEMLVQNRQKLAQMRYDESKESTYTDEEKTLHFTNQIVSYQQKIEDSLLRQKILQEQIASATGDEKTKLQRELSIEEENVAKWQQKIPTYQNKLSRLQSSKSQNVTETLTLDGGLFGGIASLVRGALDGANVNIDTEELAKEVTLQAILSVLSGVGISDSSQTISAKDYESKVARIAELESKKTVVTEKKTSKKFPADTMAEAEAFYKTLGVKSSELEFDSVKKRVVELKQVIDTLYDEGKSDTIEFINAQTELSKLLSGWRNTIGKQTKTNPEVYGENGLDNWKSYLTSNLFNDLENIPLQRTSKKNYLSQVRKIYRESQVDTTPVSGATKSNLTKKERKELKQLREEVKNYSPTNGSTKGLIQSPNGLATEGTLLDILNAIRSGEIKISNVKPSSSDVTRKNGDGDSSSKSSNSIVARINKYAETIKNAQTDGYLMDADENVAKFKSVVSEINGMVDAIESGTPATDELNAQLETLYRKAVDIGDVINKTVNKNKNLYTGTKEMNAVESQFNNIMASANIPDQKSPMINLESSNNPSILQQYISAYVKLNQQYEEYVNNRQIHDPKIQQQLKQQAAHVQTLGKRAASSIREAQNLQQLVAQSGVYETKQGDVKDFGGTKTLAESDVKNLEDAMRRYVKELGQGNAENIKFNKTSQRLTYTFRVNEDTVADMVVQYNKATNALYAYNKEERESLTGWAGFVQSYKAKLKSITQYMMSITSITDIIRYARQGITYIREIDSALTELKKVTDETEESYDRFLNTAAKTADNVGSTIKDVVSSTADWARLGYSMQEAHTLAESTQILMNVSEFTDVSTATDSLISSIQAFKYTANESMDVVDILNTIGNNYAISTADLAQSLTKSSGSLVAANGTLEEAVALTATANTIIQDADVVGTALKTVSMRLRGTSVEEMEEEGLDVDGAVTSKSKLRGKIQALSGIDILTDTGSYKSTYQILSEIASVWKDIDDMDQAALLELLAGKRAGSVMSAILQNPETLKNAFESANDASGSALKENEKYLDSIQGRIDLFNNAIQTMWSTELDSGVVKFFVNLGTSLVKIVDNLGLINTLVFALMTYFTNFRKKGKYDFVSMLGIHDMEKGWFFNRKSKQQGASTLIPTEFTPTVGEQASLFDDSSQTRAQLNEKIQQLNTYKSELKSLQNIKWKDIQIPDDALEYKTGNRKRAYVNEVLIPNKQAEIIAVQKDIDDITQAAEVKLNQSKAQLKEGVDGQLMFDFGDEPKPTNSKYLDIFENGLGKGATEKLKVDSKKLSSMLDEISSMDNQGIRQYMLNLGELGDEAGDTEIALAAYASTVEDGKYSVQGAQRFVRQYNQDLARMSKEAQKAQIKQSLLNTALSLAAMAISALVTSLINEFGKAQDEFEKLTSEIESTTSELSKLESELNNINEQIEELQNQGSLSFTDQEELERLKTTSAELERQIDLQKTLQEQQQRKMNNAAYNAAEYYKSTGVNTGKTASENIGSAAGTGAIVGAGIGATAAGSAIGSAILGAIKGGASGSAAGPWGAVIGVVIGLIAGAVVGAGVGAIQSAEEKVGESLDNTKKKYDQLQKEYEEARSKYQDNPSDVNQKKLDEAKKAFDDYAGSTSEYLTNLSSYYSSIDLDTASDDIKKEVQAFYDKQDQWAIQSGGQNAKSNAITRIFGENADQTLQRVKDRMEDVVKNIDGFEDLHDVNLEDMFPNEQAFVEFQSRLYEMGLTVTDVKYYFYDLKEAEEDAIENINIYDTIQEVANLEDSVNSLKSAMEEMYENGIVSASTLVELKELADGIEGIDDEWTNFVNAVGSGTSSFKEASESARELLNAIISRKLSDGKLELEEYVALVSQLSSLGINNATELINAKQIVATVKAIAHEAVTAVPEIYSGKNADGETVAMAFSPVLPNGEILTPEQLKEYADNVIAGAPDTKGLVVDVGVEFKGRDAIDEIQKYLNEHQITIYDGDPTKGLIEKYEEEFGIELSDEQKDALLSKAIELEDTQKRVDDAKTQQNEYDAAVKAKQDAHDKINALDQMEQNAANNLELIGNEYNEAFSNFYNVVDPAYAEGKITAEEWQAEKNRLSNLELEYQKASEDYNELSNVIIPEQKAKAQAEYDAIEIPVNPNIDEDALDAEVEAVSDAFDDLVDELGLNASYDFVESSKMVDDIQSTFDTLASAEKEYKENGYFSVDTMQSLLDIGPEYLALLYDENGNLNLNKDTLYKVALARLEDMKLKSQNTILSEAEQLATNGSIDALNSQVNAMSNVEGGYDALIESRLLAIRTSLEERKALKPTEDGYLDSSFDIDAYIQGIRNQLNAVDKTVESTKANVQNSLSSSGNTVKDEVNDAFQKAMTYWENRIGANQARYEQIQNEIDLLESQGKRAGVEYYQEQIKLEEERRRLLEAQKNEAKNFLGTFKEGSDEWWEVANQLNDIEGELDDVTSSIQELSDAMAQVHWDNITEISDRFSSLHDELSDIRDILQADEMFDDEGNWTEAGVGALATYIQELEMYKNEVVDINTELAKLQNPYGGNESYYKTLGIDSEQELYDKREELSQQQREYVKGAEDAAKAIADSYSEQIDAIEEYTDTLVESYNDYIDVVKSALEAERD